MFIICWLLHPDPRWRATIRDLEENEWINQPVDITNYSFDAVMGEFIFLITVQIRREFHLLQTVSQGS